MFFFVRKHVSPTKKKANAIPLVTKLKPMKNGDQIPSPKILTRSASAPGVGPCGSSPTHRWSWPRCSPLLPLLAPEPPRCPRSSGLDRAWRGVSIYLFTYCVYSCLCIHVSISLFVYLFIYSLNVLGYYSNKLYTYIHI